MAVTGAASGNGFEILFQGYNWESHKHNWWVGSEKRGRGRKVEILRSQLREVVAVR